MPDESSTKPGDPSPIAQLTARLRLACQWLTDVAQVRAEADVTAEQRIRHRQRSWTGAIRGEYSLAARKWGFYCPCWHTGEAVNALVMAAPWLGEPALACARRGADFLLANQVADGRDAGLLLAFEDYPDLVNTSAQLESVAGLFALTERTGERKYETAALNILRWVAERAYLRGEGRFRDLYDPERGDFVTDRAKWSHRPLFDHGAFLSAYQRTGERFFLDICRETAEILLREEEPAGNWVGIQPSNHYRRTLHPRQAFWFGRAFLPLYAQTGESRFLFQFERCVQWYRQALRRDGGFFRNTGVDFSTGSFGHCTSGSACAALMFIDYMRAYRTRDLMPELERALEFCCTMQLTAPQDENVRGAVIEVVKEPDGTDASPYHIRDLATIYAVQAWAAFLASQDELAWRPDRTGTTVHTPGVSL